MNNPYGANQYQVDPRQAKFLANYLDINSETYSNCLQSALKAGFSKEYAENLLNLMPKWLSESMDSMLDMKRLKKAEKVLDKVLDMKTVDEEGKVDNQLLKTQTDVAKFVGSTIGKKKYSTRNELTGANGEKLIEPQISDEQFERLIRARAEKLNNQEIL